MSVQVSYGNAGWVRVDAHDVPGLLYLRYTFETGRPVLTELYLDGRGEEVRTGLLRQLDLAGLNALVLGGTPDSVEHLKSRSNLPGPDLSTLASHYATTWNKPTEAGVNWVADSMRAQYRGSDVPRVKRATERTDTEVKEPAPVMPPEDGLTDEFLQSVARRYVWEVMNRRRPAPVIAEQAGVSVRTAQSWFAKARRRGFLGPTTPGKVG